MATRPHFFSTEPDVKYESIPEKIGIGIMTAHVIAARLGQMIRRPFAGVRSW